MLAVQELEARAVTPGQKVNTDGADNGQCTAIPHLWEEMNGWPVVLGNAKDTLNNAPGDFYTKSPYTEGNYPEPGSIIVWGPEWGEGYGHTAVVVSANASTFMCVEQNDGDNGLPHVGEHNYGGVIGWFQPHPTPAAPAFPRTVSIFHPVNVRTAPSLEAQVVTGLHIGTCVILQQVEGPEGDVAGKTSTLWDETLNHHWFNDAATQE